jgi:hypothetical protein
VGRQGEEGGAGSVALRESEGPARGVGVGVVALAFVAALTSGGPAFWPVTHQLRLHTLVLVSGSNVLFTPKRGVIAMTPAVRPAVGRTDHDI